MDHHACAAGMLGYQEQRQHVALVACIADYLLDVAIPAPFGVDEQLGHRRGPESQQLSQTLV